LEADKSPAEREASRQEWIAQIDQTASVLYKELLEVIHLRLQEWKETKAAFVIGGLLGLLPLHAASWQEDDQSHYLLERLDIIYGPSVWVLKRCLARHRDKEIPVLAAGTSGQGPSLIFSRWEVKRIGELLESTKGPGTCLQVLDSAATATFILEEMPKYAVSHLACHGKWNASEPLDSSLSMYDEDLTLARLLQRVRLDNSRLVVLSACESGTGHSYNKVSEEFVGLPAGFIFAGARSVVGSLWSVLDPPTALFDG
jgi:CHAT domain-containing protein